MLAPAETLIDPPPPEFVDDTVMVNVPAAPPVAAPVDTKISPTVPAVVEPVTSLTGPLAVCFVNMLMDREPLICAVPFWVRNVRSPAAVDVTILVAPPDDNRVSPAAFKLINVPVFVVIDTAPAVLFTDRGVPANAVMVARFTPLWDTVNTVVAAPTVDE